MPTQTSAPATVAKYFKKKMGREIKDDQGLTRKSDFTVETECGIDCARTIDKGAELIEEIRAAVGDRGSDVINVINAVEHTVLVFVYG